MRSIAEQQSYSDDIRVVLYEIETPQGKPSRWAVEVQRNGSRIAGRPRIAKYLVGLATYQRFKIKASNGEYKPKVREKGK